MTMLHCHLKMIWLSWLLLAQHRIDHLTLKITDSCRCALCAKTLLCPKKLLSLVVLKDMIKGANIKNYIDSLLPESILEENVKIYE